jgi:hypothetical protein
VQEVDVTASRAGRIIGGGLILIGAAQLGLAAFMIGAPDAFFETLGPFGEQNDHYIQDSAAFEAAIGIAALLAVSRPTWQLPVLVVAGFHYGLHGISHVVDVAEADPAWSGILDAIALPAAAAGCAVLAYVCRFAHGHREASS